MEAADRYLHETYFGEHVDLMEYNTIKSFRRQPVKGQG